MPIKYVDGKKIHLPYPKKSNSTTTKSPRRVSTTRKKPTTRPAK